MVCSCTFKKGWLPFSPPAPIYLLECMCLHCRDAHCLVLGPQITGCLGVALWLMHAFANACGQNPFFLTHTVRQVNWLFCRLVGKEAWFFPGHSPGFVVICFSLPMFCSHMKANEGITDNSCVTSYLRIQAVGQSRPADAQVRWIQT